MLPKEKEELLLRYLTAGLIKASKSDTETELGDRSQYIGLSDIGKAFECMRSAVADKAGMVSSAPIEEMALQTTPFVEKSLKKQLVLQRGHWQEYGVEKALYAMNPNTLSQLEIAVVIDDVPIKAHLDFTVIRDAPRFAIRVLELKSNEHIPTQLYASYEAQLYGQLGLLYRYWSQPCFRIVSEQKPFATFPELVKEQFGINLPADPQKVDIEGWVLSISMSKLKSFGPYTHDPVALEACLNIGKELWSSSQLVRRNEIPLDSVAYTKGFHPLCEFCSVNKDCPKFVGHDVLGDREIQDTLEGLARLKAEEKMLAGRRKEIEQNLKTYYALTNCTQGEWIDTADYRFRVAQMQGRKGINYDRLVEDLGEDLIAKYREIGKPYEQLFVGRINSRINSKVPELMQNKVNV